MVVITLTDCPPSVRGDLTKWLLEINAGVYCGQLSARVRDELWERICDNIKEGRATMVFSAPGEQHLDFRIHNSNWQPVDYDGIKLIMHPDVQHRRKDAEKSESYRSNAEIQRIARASQKKRTVLTNNTNYCIVDIETTGLSIESSKIIELAALRVRDGQIVDRYRCLVKGCEKVPDSIEELTEITAELIQENGKEEVIALGEFVDFIGEDLLVGYHVNFDFNFIQRALEKCGKKRLRNRQLDVMIIARKKLDDVGDFKLSTVADALGVPNTTRHRAMQDCLTLYEVYNKLNKV